MVTNTVMSVPKRKLPSKILVEYLAFILCVVKKKSWRIVFLDIFYLSP
jgi:hypothetical protein